jgi:hypothetical protein
MQSPRVLMGVLVLALACSCAEQPGGRPEAAFAPPSATTSTPIAPVTPTSTTVPSPVGELASASSARWDNLQRAHDPRRLPVRLLIDSLGVDSPISARGIDADGALELPSDNSTVAWFSGGAVPGDAGATLLAAHVDHDGLEGVFFHLRDLAPATTIRVALADGTTQTFVVDGAPTNVRKSALPGEQIFRTTGPSTLVLVTCGGTFDRTARSYEDNTIVTAHAAS